MTESANAASTASVPELTPAQLQERLSELMLRDESRLRRRLDGARKVKNPHKRAEILADIASQAGKAAPRVEKRRAAMPVITYPEQLPVSQKKDEILAAVRDNQVVIVAGETGSGKTTQLPKICLELGRGVRGYIGHTQPRRLAARSVADRIAEELGTTLGEAVGYKVRFNDQVGQNSLVKLMTDGILLAEIQHDRLLMQYDTIIIDEAHERSLNIDFILGYIQQLLPQRPDLKVIITSATIDPERFAKHFGDAPIIEVSGRTFPVEVRYRPLIDDSVSEEDDDLDDAITTPDRDQVQGILDAVDELIAEGPGDILVFLSGERDIRDAEDALKKWNTRKSQFGQVEIVPLYARLSSAEQHRVFTQGRGRRIVLATNVAETSLTVPGIKYVIDPGTARISRYSHRLKVQRLPIEPVSQASANQRKGRSGRTSDGICIRLYSEKDFESRPEFTDAEILRTNLASVILQMTSLDLGDIAAFPFIDPPDHRNIADGVNLLHELGAVNPREKDPKKRLTPLGRQLAQLPVDPRFARMVIEGQKNGCVREVLVIAAALSIQDPRERPQDKKEQAQQQHARFVNKEVESDFMSFLNLWEYVRTQQKELSSSRFRKLCKTEFLNYLRIREWQDLYSQLKQVIKSMDITVDENSEPADPQRIHTSLLSGLLSHIGLKDPSKQDYFGARGGKWSVFPGSSLFKKPPRWVMSAELVETSRLWGRICAKIEPEWVEPLAEHLVKKNYSEPHWSLDSAAVMAYEKVMLYGIPIVAQRKVNYGRIDPELSRELFIRHALVQGEWKTHHQFLKENRKLLDEVEELEHRARRRDIVVDDEVLFDFYDERIPEDVVSGRHFDSWWKKARLESPDLLSFEKSMLVRDSAGEVTADAYPDWWRQDELKFRLTYQFEPGADADGVTVHIPLAVLNQVHDEGFDWQIPGLRSDVATELIRSLPKATRRNFVPAPDYAREALRRLNPDRGYLSDELARELTRMTGIRVPLDAWDLTKVPDHLRMTFRILDEKRKTLAEGKDLSELKDRLAPKMQQAITAAAEVEGLERHGITKWDFGELPRTFEHQMGGGRGRAAVKGFPALVDEGTSVGIKLFHTPEEQQQAMWAGTRRLILLQLTASPVKHAQGKLSNPVKLALGHNPHGSTAALFEDCLNCACDKIVREAGGPVWDAVAFDLLVEKVRLNINAVITDAVGKVANILHTTHAVERKIRDVRSPAQFPAVTDIKKQLGALVFKDFATAATWPRLADVLRYIRGIDRRLGRLAVDVTGDRQRMEKVHQVESEYRDLLAELRPGQPVPEALLKIRWMTEELRVSYFAQGLGTAYSISDKRIYKAMDEYTGV